MNKYDSVADQVAFVRQNGDRLHSLLSLREALEHMSDAEYARHVNTAKNDFANWIEGVFELRDIAQKVRNTKTKADTIRVLHEELYGRLPSYIGGVFKKKEPQHHHSHHTHLEHLDKHLAHMTRHEHHMTSRHPGTSAHDEESIKARVLDFALGLIVGLLLGLILGRSLGIF